MGHRKRRSLLAAAAMAAMAAQAAVSASPETAPAADTPGIRAAAPASRPASSRPASTRPASMPSSITLNFKDTPLDTVLDYLSKTLGFEVIKDGPIDARVNIVNKQPVSPEEAITLVNAALSGNGFIAVRDGKILRVTARDKAKKGNVPVHFGNDPDTIPNTDEMITQVVPITNVNATKLKDELKGFMGDAEVGANDASNSLIITDNASAIRRIVEIIAKLDEHEAETSEIRIVRLLHANASATAKLIDTFFKPAPSGAPQMNPQQMMMMQQQGQPIPQASSGRHGATVITAADDRTNTLLVMASTSSLKIIDNIIKNVDSDLSSPAAEMQMRAFPLKYAVAEDTAKLINSVFKPPRNNNDDFFFFFPRNNTEDKTNLHINAAFDLRTNTLIVTGTPEGLRQVEKLVETLDANPMAAAELQVYHLKHANAFTVQGMIEDMFKPKSDSQPRYGYYYYMSEQANPQQNSKISVNVTSDDRTNTLIVTAPADLIKVIGKVVEELDTDPTTEDTLFIYHLRNAQSQNVEYVLNVLFGNITNGQENNQQNQNGQNQQNQQNQNNRFSNNATRSNNSFGNSNNNGSSNGSINRSYNNSSNNQNRQGQNGGNPAKSENELTGKALVVADPDTNSLLVTTASKYEKQVLKIIQDLDRPVPQVLIRVLVAEVTHDNSADLGLDFSVLDQRASGKGLSVNSGFGNAGATPGVIVSVVESNITATLHALAQKDKLDVLSRPYILASDNQLANIFIGSTVPFVTNSQITEAGQLINTVQYQDIGLNLNVTPHINPDGVVILDVNPAVQQLTSQSITITANTSSPVISKRSADSRIAVQDGQTIVIGGMMEDRKTSTITGIPFLRDIPGLGLLFSRTQVSKTKTELLIFLTPHVAQRPDMLEPMADEEQKGLRLTPSAVQPGTWDEQMKGMRRGGAPHTQPTQPVSPVDSINLSDSTERRPTDPPTTAPSTAAPTVR